MSDNKKLDLIASLQKNNQRQEEEKVNLQFGDIDIIFYDDHIQFICEDVEYSLEQFTAMMNRWKAQQNKGE